MSVLEKVVMDDLTVSHRVIADLTNNKHKSIQDLITKNESDFREFGTLRFKIAGVVNNGKGEQPKDFELNEPQATLLMTYLRNSDIVRAFKKRLVKEFFELKQQQKVAYNRAMAGKLGGRSMQLKAMTKKYDTMKLENEKYKKDYLPKTKIETEMIKWIQANEKSVGDSMKKETMNLKTKTAVLDLIFNIKKDTLDLQNFYDKMKQRENRLDTLVSNLESTDIFKKAIYDVETRYNANIDYEYSLRKLKSVEEYERLTKLIPA